jgi:hypothetical protein
VCDFVCVCSVTWNDSVESPESYDCHTFDKIYESVTFVRTSWTSPSQGLYLHKTTHTDKCPCPECCLQQDVQAHTMETGLSAPFAE